MNRFSEAVVAEVARGLKSVTHPVQGYVPRGGISGNDLKPWRWKATEVRIPNPHGGLDQGQAHLTLSDVPLPRTLEGAFQALAGMVQQQDVGVLIGFKGGSISHPFIIQFLKLDPNETTLGTEERQGATGAKFSTTRTPVPPAAAALDLFRGLGLPEDPYEGTLAGSSPPSADAVAKTGIREAELRAEFEARFKAARTPGP